MYKITLIAAVIFAIGQKLSAQTLFVDPVKGSDNANGSQAAPLASLPKAVALAGTFSGTEPISIKLAPGLYQLTSRLDITAGNNLADPAKFTIEAQIMPDDTTWNGYRMPVIMSVSGTNDQRKFPHAVGVIVARSNVVFRGLKFTGDPNPEVFYYYPVVRDSLGAHGLELSQCLFEGDRNSAAIQGALYLEGPGIHIDHCVFYGCKNALLAFENVSDVSLTHSIILDAYECAIWYGWKNVPNEPFTFEHNVVSGCRAVLLAVSDQGAPFHFSHCLLTDNQYYMVKEANNDSGSEPSAVQPQEEDVRKSGHIQLMEVTTYGYPHDNLNLVLGSYGYDIGASLFINPKKHVN